MRLIFVGEEGDIALLKTRLDSFAGIDWEQQHKNIRLVTVRDRRNSKEVRARLKDALRPVEETSLYLLRNDIRFDQGGLPEIHSLTRPSGNLEAFLQKYLRPALQEINADWRKHAENILKDWDYPESDEEMWHEERVSKWLGQFERLGYSEAKKIGEMLLRCLEGRTRSALTSCFKNAAPGLHCVMRYENGKSADAISGLLKKGVMHNSGNVHNFDDLIRTPLKPDEKIVIYEDGLFSGTEWVGIFESLMGVSTSPKCDKLADISVLQKQPIEIRFAVATDLGVNWLKKNLIKLGLNQIEIKATETIKALSAIGEQRLVTGTLFSADGKVERDSVQQRIFQDTRWFGDVALATTLCDEVGRNLWSHYWTSKGKTVSVDALDRVALGASNLGFALAFPFSIPKVTLPLFWCPGKVPRRPDLINGVNRNFQWVPLFPNAA